MKLKNFEAALAHAEAAHAQDNGNAPILNVKVVLMGGHVVEGLLADILTNDEIVVIDAAYVDIGSIMLVEFDGPEF